MEHEFDFLVIGSGIAGLTFALKAASMGTVAIVTKKDKLETSTNYAQGGIASALGPDDSFDLHIQDTLAAGDGLCKREIVELVVRSAPERIKELVEWGVEFTRRGDGPLEFDLGREGGHSRNRIVHAQDMTGQAIEKALIRAAEKHPNITIFENTFAIDLIVEYEGFRIGDILRNQRKTCWGVYALRRESSEVDVFLAKATVLCTGGAGKVYLYTSNPDVATGDGLAMAYRAGARLANLEFVQFHPTCLYHPKAKNFLISEAVRGEGGRLIDRHGRPFMHKYHPLGDLAFRDVVARAIDTEMKQSGDDCVFLDITHRGRDFLIKRFPNIYQKCLSLGIDMAKEPIPVVPAAHYMCGGIQTDSFGRTSIERAYAIGECACTGLHGANRLASNSLLEAVVFAHQAYLDIAANAESLKKVKFPDVKSLDNPFRTALEANQSEMVFIAHNWDVIRKIMWNYVGIVRRDKRLELAQNHIAQIRREIEEHMPNIPLNTDALELRNLSLVAQLIVSCALKRKESRGLHYNLDHPKKDDEKWQKDTIIVRDNESE
ncbi:L-aspartate oxidase [Thermodesulforhabdus norvegica]|uniref:L-aspartate oxidase n=1 Tax=Thermodesulforhabdus norvegica TaxID=39841 RepID=A0A1I4SBE0_9BACT|nr:L-aspartate oxidase [Thermodesulforhabdus norvegica]SFM61593.1 L-aspartate oxidase [Thermodesulforhabdus norvegica]